MNRIRTFLSRTFLALAVLLVGYGYFGLSHFEWYTGEYFDDRLAIFDNGCYPFFWGTSMLVVAQLIRLKGYRVSMGIAAISGLALFMWKRSSMPALSQAGLSIFPDAQLLNELIVVCSLLLLLVLSDRIIQRGIKVIVLSPLKSLCRFQKSK